MYYVLEYSVVLILYVELIGIGSGGDSPSTICIVFTSTKI